MFQTDLNSFEKNLENNKMTKKFFQHQLNIEKNLKRKRHLDLGLILLASPFLVPVFALISVLIKVGSRGPVFYVSKRVGKNGQLFKFYKFRSMVTDADKVKDKLADQNESADKVMFKMKNDPRVTRIGKVLRKTSLDELPQLINVALGDMSLVGPRPPIKEEVDKYKLFQQKRLHFVPGITCLWQISGRSNIPFEKQVKLDLEYINNYSVKSDLKILLGTIPAVIKGDGAY